MRWSKLPKFLIILSVIGLLGFFQNCAKAPDIAEEDLASNSQQNKHVPCSADSTTTGEATQVIQFPSSMSTICPFSSGANLAPKAGFAQARVEQVLQFKLPKNAVICSAALDFQDADIFVGSMFMLSLNQRVMMASHTGLIAGLPADTSSGDRVYSWANVAGKAGTGKPYCLDGNKGAICEYKELATAKHYNFRYTATEDYIRQTLAEVPSGNHNFRFITIGDDDPSDCNHNGLLGQIHVTYDIE